MATHTGWKAALTAALGHVADITAAHQITLTAPLALTVPAGFPAGQVYRVTLTQDATGGHTVTYGGQPVTVDTTAGAQTEVELWPNGTATRTVVHPGAKPLAGQTVMFLGDSLTQAGTYPERVAAITGATVIKGGFSGARMSRRTDDLDRDAFSATRIAAALASGDWAAQDAADLALGGIYATPLAALKAANLSTVTHLVIFYGGNDWSGGAPLGSPTDTTGDTVCGAVNLVVQTIQAVRPDIDLRFIVRPWRTAGWVDNDDANIDNTFYVNGLRLGDMTDAIALMAQRNRIPCLDLQRLAGITKHNASTYLVDGIHLTAAGYALIAGLISDFLASTPNPGNADESFGREHWGTGSPEGVVTAPLGAHYTDKAATNGARRWRKGSTSGNTGWKVIEGDTGWRMLAGAGLATGAVYLRRVNEQVYFTIRGGDYDTFSLSATITAGSSLKTIPNYGVPAGFIPSAYQLGPITNNGRDVVGMLAVTPVADANYVSLRAFSAGTVPGAPDLLRVPTFVYDTVDGWPTGALPGAAV